MLRLRILKALELFLVCLLQIQDKISGHILWRASAIFKFYGSLHLNAVKPFSVTPFYSAHIAAFKLN